MSSNPYWNGEVMAKFDSGEVRAEWGNGEHSGTSIAFCNRAFQIFFEARQNCMKLSDHMHAEEIRKVLEDCGRTGYGTGVSDMEEAFDHYASKGGYWTDDDTTLYFGGPERVFSSAIVMAPRSIVRFMNAVDEKGSRLLVRTIRDYQKLIQKLSDLLRGSAGASAAVKDFEKSIEVIGSLKSAAEHARPWLWTAPAYETRVGHLVTVTDVIGKMQEGALAYTMFRFAGFGVTESAAVTALREAIGHVPVLGSFYQKAIDLIPAVAASFGARVRGYHDTIEMAMHAR